MDNDIQGARAARQGAPSKSTNNTNSYIALLVGKLLVLLAARQGAPPRTPLRREGRAPSPRGQAAPPSRQARRRRQSGRQHSGRGDAQRLPLPTPRGPPARPGARADGRGPGRQARPGPGGAPRRHYFRGV